MSTPYELLLDKEVWKRCFHNCENFCLRWKHTAFSRWKLRLKRSNLHYFFFPGYEHLETLFCLMWRHQAFPLWNMQYFWYKFETTADSSINYNKRENFTFSCSANLVPSAKYAALKRKSSNLTNTNCSADSTWVTSNRPKWRLNCCPLKVAI